MSIQEKLQKGRDRLNKAGNDVDMLGLAMTSIHGALEDACRHWLAAPEIKQQHGVDVQNKAEANWQNLLELMPRYCGWSEQDVRYVRKMNGLRNKAAHGEGFEGTRQDVEQYLNFVENAIAKGGTFSDSASETYNVGNIAIGNISRPTKSQNHTKVINSDVPKCPNCASYDSKHIDSAKDQLWKFFKATARFLFFTTGMITVSNGGDVSSYWFKASCLFCVAAPVSYFLIQKSNPTILFKCQRCACSWKEPFYPSLFDVFGKIIVIVVTSFFWMIPGFFLGILIS